MNKLLLTTTLLMGGMASTSANAQQRGVFEVQAQGQASIESQLDVRSRYPSDREDSRDADHDRDDWREHDQDRDDGRDHDQDRHRHRYGDRDRYDSHWYHHDHRRHDRHGWPHQRYHARYRYYEPRGYEAHVWRPGHRLPPPFYARHYYVDYRYYGLPPPPRGYQWVRVHNDVYLVATGSGLIRNILYDLFY